LAPEFDGFQHAQDQAAIAMCEAIRATNEPGMPHEEFMAVLGAAESG
jgi:hypothetical protein